MLDPVESQAVTKSVSKQEALDQYAPQIEQIRDTFNLARNLVASINSSDFQKSEDYDSNPLRRYLGNLNYVLFDYPEQDSNTVMEASDVISEVTGDNMKRLIMSLPDPLTPEKELAIKAIEDFCNFVCVADALFNVHKHIEARFGITESEVVPLHALPDKKHVPLLSMDNIIEIEKFKSDMSKHKMQFESHKRFFELATPKQSHEAASLQDTSVPTGLRDIAQEM